VNEPAPTEKPTNPALRALCVEALLVPVRLIAQEMLTGDVQAEDEAA
jgi:hypothetical protein